MKNYRQKLKEIKTPFFRFFHGLLCAYYAIQVVLHFSSVQGFIFEDASILSALNLTEEKERSKFYVHPFDLVFFELRTYECGGHWSNDRDSYLLLQ